MLGIVRNMQKTKSYRTLAVNISLLCVVLIFCFVILEITVCVLSPSIFHPSIKLIPDLNVTRSVELNGVSPIIHHTTNKWGFRGDSIPDNISDNYFILAIGGSTTQCFYLDDYSTWPNLLQEGLVNLDDKPVIVQNAGIDGHTSRGHLLMMEHVVPQVNPDMIIFLVGINDLGLSLKPDRFYNGSPYEEIKPIYWLFTKSRLLQMLYSWKQVFFGEVVLVSHGHTNLVLNKMSQPESTFSDGFEDELISLDEYENNLREIIQLGKEQNIRMLFMIQPTLFDDTDEWAMVEGRSAWLNNQEYYISARTLNRMLDRFNNVTVDVCEDEEVEYLDLASYIPHSSKYYYDAIHFNDAGSELVADFILNYIVYGGNSIYGEK